MKKIICSMACVSLYSLSCNAYAEGVGRGDYFASEAAVNASSGNVDDEFSLKNPPFAGWYGAREAAPDVELRYGGFVGTRYRSNIYRERTGATSDVVGVVAPAFSVRSDLEKHEVQVKGRVEAGFYNRNTENDYVNADLQATGRLDVAENEYVSLHGRARHENVEIGGFIEDASSPLTRSNAPIAYRFFDVGGEYHKPLGERVIGKIGTAVQLYDYDNGTRADGSALVQDSRDRTEYYGYSELGYQATQQLTPFVSADINHRAYHRQVDSTALYERDSSGAGIYLGTRWQQDVAGTSSASAKLGYIHQNYQSRALPTINTIGFQAEASHYLREDTLLRALAFRRVAENNLVGASGALQTRAQAGVVHRLNEDWEIDTTGRVTQVDFEINPALRAKRVDNVVDGSVGANYYIEGPLYARADYQYIHRQSDFALANYQENRAMLSIGLKY